MCFAPKPILRIRRALIVIWMLFVLKGLFYCVLFPLWEGYDEYAHFAFIQFVATHHELPVPDSIVSREVDASLKLVPLPWLLREWLPPHVTHDAYWRLPEEERAARERALANIPSVSQTELGENGQYEGQQGPLYYWLMAPFEWIFQSSALVTRVFVFRVLNILLASAIIPIAFAAGRIFFRDESPALFATVLLGVMPELFIDSSRVGNQTLAMVLYGVLTWLCLTALEGKPQYLLIGTTLGLLLLTKAYTLAAIPAVCLVLLWAVRWPERRPRSWLLGLASPACAAIVGGWWYLRNLRLVGNLVWISGAPARPTRIPDLFRYIPAVNWRAAVDSLAGSYLWYGNWSFLTVRSWMYEVLEVFIVLIVIGIVITFVHSLRSRTDALSVRHLIVLLMLFSGFLAALAYHVLINFMNSNLSATCGWYLYAVAVPAALLAIAGLGGFGRWRKAFFLMIVGAFVALELYATNWILIPYYTGLISHTPGGALQSFHPGRVSISVAEFLTRLHANRPVFVTSAGVVILWLLYVASTVGLFYIATRAVRQR